MFEIGNILWKIETFPYEVFLTELFYAQAESLRLIYAHKIIP